MGGGFPLPLKRITLMKELTKKILWKLYTVNRLSMSIIAKQIGYKCSAIRCLLLKYNIPIRNNSESHKGLRNLKYIGGYLPSYPKCAQCNDLLSRRDAKVCKKCHGNQVTGETNPNYKGGRPHCNDCRTEIWYGYKRCKSCGAKHRLSTPEGRNKQWKAIKKALKLKPNRPEIELSKILNILYPNEYKFVGDGQIIIDGFNPDFINCNGQKKIIEHYGDYWHNKPGAKEKDLRRINTYTKHGYKTLIIWEHELEKIEEVKQRLVYFNKV